MLRIDVGPNVRACPSLSSCSFELSGLQELTGLWRRNNGFVKSNLSLSKVRTMFQSGTDRASSKWLTFRMFVLSPKRSHLYWSTYNKDNSTRPVVLSVNCPRKTQYWLLNMLIHYRFSCGSVVVFEVAGNVYRLNSTNVTVTSSRDQVRTYQTSRSTTDASSNSPLFQVRHWHGCHSVQAILALNVVLNRQNQRKPDLRVNQDLGETSPFYLNPSPWCSSYSFLLRVDIG